MESRDLVSVSKFSGIVSVSKATRLGHKLIILRLSIIA